MYIFIDLPLFLIRVWFELSNGVFFVSVVQDVLLAVAWAASFEQSENFCGSMVE